MKQYHFARIHPAGRVMMTSSDSGAAQGEAGLGQQHHHAGHRVHAQAIPLPAVLRPGQSEPRQGMAEHQGTRSSTVCFVRCISQPAPGTRGGGGMGGLTFFADVWSTGL